MAVIGASQLGLHYAEMEIFGDITLQVNEKARIGIVGPNGSGKTSLLRVLLGEQDYDSGTIFRPEQLRIGYVCLLYTSPSPRDGLLSRMPSSA